MVNSPSELNYLFLHRLGFKFNGLNGVYSEDIGEVSPASGNNLHGFNSLDLGVDYSELRSAEGEILSDPDAAVEYRFSYDDSDDDTSLILERSDEKIAAVLQEDGENESNSVLRDLKWAFDRLESDERISSGSLKLLDYSESDGRMIIEHEY